MALGLEGRVALVAGGSGGIGSSLCEYLAGRGAGVAVHYNGSASHAEDLVQSIRAKGGQAQAFQADVTDQASVERVVAEVAGSLGTVDILVNCAGISRNGMAWKVDPDQWFRTLQVNLYGAFHFIRATLPAMREKGAGRIITLSSIVGSIGVPGTSAYAASKAGLEGMTRAIAVEVANRGITVNALALGYMDAGIIADVPKDKLDRILATIPVGRLGKVSEVCGMVDFLCSEPAAYVTGQTLHVNGGLFLN